MFSLRTIALKHVSSQHPIKCNTVAFDVISLILLLSLPVKGQVLPDEDTSPTAEPGAASQGR